MKIDSLIFVFKNIGDMFPDKLLFGWQEDHNFSDCSSNSVQVGVFLSESFLETQHKQPPHIPFLRRNMSQP